MFRSVGFIALCLAGIVATCSNVNAQVRAAQNYPDKTVRLVVPFPAGGATDIIARLIADRLASAWSKPVVIENIAGAAGAIATGQAAKAAPDGHTLLTATGTTMTLLPHLRGNLSFDTLRDFDAVALICTFPNLLVVQPNLPAKSVKELIELAKANPGKYSYASTGYGGSPHIAAEWFKLITRTDILHVPYTGSGPAQPALLGGHVDMMFDTMPTVWPLVQAGKLRALGVTSSERVPFIPDVPTIGETLPGYDVTSWLGIVVPAGTPADIRAKISAQLAEVLKDPAIVQRLKDVAAVASFRPADEFAAFIRKDYEKWRNVVRDTGIKLNN